MADEWFYSRLFLAAVVAVTLAIMVVPSALAPPPNSITLLTAGSSSYATGSSLNGTFTLKHPALVTGAFVTNASATLTIQQSSFPSDVAECQTATVHCYTTGSVGRAVVGTSLMPGSYRFTVTFTNSTTDQTWLNVTQSLVATYQ